jgi:hypothetical protein
MSSQGLIELSTISHGYTPTFLLSSNQPNNKVKRQGVKFLARTLAFSHPDVNLDHCNYGISHIH